MEYGSVRVKFVYECHRVKVTGTKVENSYSRNEKLRICRNSGSIKHRATRFACSMGFSDMADRMV